MQMTNHVQLTCITHTHGSDWSVCGQENHWLFLTSKAVMGTIWDGLMPVKAFVKLAESSYIYSSSYELKNLDGYHRFKSQYWLGFPSSLSWNKFLAGEYLGWY